MQKRGKGGKELDHVEDVTRKKNLQCLELVLSLDRGLGPR